MTIVNDRTITPPIHDPELDRRVKSAGASKTVYALVTPRPKAAKNFILGNAVAGRTPRGGIISNNSATPGPASNSPRMRPSSNAGWSWAAPVVAIDRGRCFPGAIRPPAAAKRCFMSSPRTAIAPASRNSIREVHVFAGEYEGYKAYAEACGIAVIEHPRSHWQAVARTLPDDALFCLSQPSAIDGNVWPHANDFLALARRSAERPRVLLDVAYVGSIAEAPAARIAADSPAVQALAFSLSKPFGVYYDRIGGMLCRDAMPSLFGNQWFKNLTSLQLGMTLLERHDVFDLPRRYKQCPARGGNSNRPSPRADALALRRQRAGPGKAQRHRRPRACGFPASPGRRSRCTLLRLCLTPTMAEMIGTAGPIAAPGGAS